MQREGIRNSEASISFWLRRLCETALFVSATILIFYLWSRFFGSVYRLQIGELLSDVTALSSLVLSSSTTVVLLWPPQQKQLTVGIGLCLLTLFTLGTIFITGDPHSNLTTTWLPVGAFAGALSCRAVIHIWKKHPRGDSRDKTYSDLENRLSHVENKSDIVINAIDDGVLAIAQDGAIELINPSAQQIIGWQGGDALGLHWQSVIKLVNSDGREASASDNPIVQALRFHKPTHSDKLMMLTSSDKRILVSIVSSPIGEDETSDGVIVVFRNITKEKAEERQQAEFISTASHEMRNPVATIEGYLGLVLNPATARIDTRARNFVTKAHESARHLGRLLQDLLDVSKAEDGRLKNEPRVININRFTKTIFEGLAPLAAEKQLQYVFRPDIARQANDSERVIDPVYYSHVDPDHLREVITNLIENAIKYTPEGQVVVDVAGDDERIAISVADSGIGIPAEDVPHLFQKFYRVDNSETREINGTGLGLYLSRRLAENMSGNIHVESQYKRGSIFRLEIPRISHHDAMARLDEEKIQRAASQLAQQSRSIPVVAAASQSAQSTKPSAQRPTPHQHDTSGTTTTTIAHIEQQLAQRPQAQRRIDIAKPANQP